MHVVVRQHIHTYIALLRTKKSLHIHTYIHYKANGTVTNTETNDEDSDFGDLEPNNDGWGGREGQPDLSKMSSLKSHKTEVVP